MASTNAIPFEEITASYCLDPNLCNKVMLFLLSVSIIVRSI